MGGQNTNNRYYMRQISYNYFGNITICFPKGLVNVTFNEASMEWDDYKGITSSFYIIISSNQRKIHDVNYGEENLFWDGCQRDIDNRTFTHCFGMTFLTIVFTSQ